MRQRRHRFIGTHGPAVLTAALLLPLIADAEVRPPPPQLTFLNQVMHLRDVNYVYPGFTHLDWTEYEFDGSVTVRGKYWKLRGTIDGDLALEKQWSVVRAAFVAAGWSVATDLSHGGTLKHEANGLVSYAQARFFDGDTIITSIEVAPNPLKVELRPPSAKHEKMDAEKGDFPYLTPPPGAVLQKGYENIAPFWVQLQGAPPELIADKSMVRNYAPPPGFSNLEFVAAYQDALVKAGWDIISVFNSADASIHAHYAKRGRNLWIYLHLGGGGLNFSVADGATDLKASLSKDCHVALYGLLFDFNKSTLQPASAPVLQTVRALLQKSPSLKVEIQGHTDNVGDDAYNQKLSEARAAAVVKWLSTHGIASKRLSSHGYGKTQPVADNGSDEGRAKNRRVEIADPACKPAQ